MSRPLLLLLLLCSGCVAWATPPAPRPPAPAISAPPAMLVAFYYEYRMDNDRKPAFEPAGERNWRAAFDATATVNPLMQRASLQPWRGHFNRLAV